MNQSSFQHAWWLPNPHLQTIWPFICRPQVNIQLERERLELPDGDFVDLDWSGRCGSGGVVILLHGFEGSINSHYAKGMLAALNRSGLRTVFMHFRGCSGEPNRLSRGYHSGDTADIAYVVEVLKQREPHTDLAAIGYSLGGNVLLKWLGETGPDNPLSAAVAVSVPFELHVAINSITRGFSQLYERYLVRCARERLTKKFAAGIAPAVDLSSLAAVQKFRELDDVYTVPLHGFGSVDEYYHYSSSRQYLGRISIPTLIIHAKDDPFMSPAVIPQISELPSIVQLELSETGGHLGFVSGDIPLRPQYWLEERIPVFVKTYLETCTT